MGEDMTDGNIEVPVVTSLLVRSTVHLPEIGIDGFVYVDPRVPYIASCLDRGFLVVVEDSPVVEEPSVVEESLALEPTGPEQLEVTPPERQEEESSDEVDPGLEDAAAAVPD